MLLSDVRLPVTIAMGDEAVAEEEDKPSDEEMEGINKIVQDTDVMKLLEGQTKDHQNKLEELHSHIDTELSGLSTHERVV